MTTKSKDYKMTRQGVRDLGHNQRARNMNAQDSFCFHEYRVMLSDPTPEEMQADPWLKPEVIGEKCSKCGKERKLVA